MRRSRLLLLLLPREPASCWKGKGGGRALGDGGDPAGDGVPLGKSWGAPTEHPCCSRVGWGLGGATPGGGDRTRWTCRGILRLCSPQLSSTPCSHHPQLGGGTLGDAGGCELGIWGQGGGSGIQTLPHLLSSQRSPSAAPPGRRGRSQGDRSRHKGRPPGSPRRAHQGSLCVPGSALITSPPSSRGVTLRARLCQTIKHARLTQIPPGSLGKRRPRGFGEGGGGHGGAGGTQAPRTPGISFCSSPPPSSFLPSHRLPALWFN